MKRITTPVLHKTKSYGSTLLTNKDGDISFCFSEIEKLWHIPESAKKFWLEIVPRPQANSVEVQLRMWYGDGVEWRTDKRGYNDFERSSGLADLLGGYLNKRKWITFNVRLLYE